MNIIRASTEKSRSSLKKLRPAIRENRNQIRKRPQGPARRVLSERAAEACAAAWKAVPQPALRRATRSKAPVASARQAAIYLAHIVFEASLTRAGGIFGRDRTTARHACSRMEDLRDDPRIDRAFDAMETALRFWVEAFSAEEPASARAEELA